MTIGKLLAYLGYDMNTPVIGRTEVSDPGAMKRLVAPRRPVEGQTKPAATPPAAKADTDDAAEMKKDEPAAKKDEPADLEQPQPKAKTAKKAEPKKKAADDEDQ
jgi:hypothetical protein